jgi:hypothetical protein
MSHCQTTLNVFSGRTLTPRQHARPGRDVERSATERAARGADAAEGLLGEPLQDSTAVGRDRYGSVLPRQLRQDARGLAEHYAFFFFNSPSTTGFVFTAQDQADMVAFLKLLR